MNDAVDPRSESDVQPKMGSDRNFGLVFAGVFSFIALWPLVRGEGVHRWPLYIAAIFLAAALVMPTALRPLNRLWFRVGMVLGKIVTPVVMGILFFVVVTPVGFLMRAFGKDPLRLKREPAAESYWIERSPPGPGAGSLKNQF
jgi:hypothetical protein